jgi:hypothetical protein
MTRPGVAMGRIASQTSIESRGPMYVRPELWAGRWRKGCDGGSFVRIAPLPLSPAACIITLRYIKDCSKAI